MTEVRQHLTGHITTARLALETKRGLPNLILYALAFLVFVVGGMGYVLRHLPGGLGDGREVRFALTDGAGITPGRSELKFKGVPAGVLRSVEFEDGRAVVTAKVKKEFGPIYRDARAVLRPNTALEDMYLDIVDRGTPSAGAAEASRPLATAQTQSSVQIEDVLDAFQPGVRKRLATMLHELGGGLEDRGDDLRAAFVEAMPLLEAAARLTGELQRQGVHTRQLVHHTGRLTEELAARERQLRQVVRSGGDLFAELGRSSGPLGETIAELAPTMRSLSSSMETVARVLPDVDRAVASLRPVAADLPTALAAVRGLSRDANPALARLREPVHRLVPLSKALVPLSASLDAGVAALEPQVGAIDHVVKSVAGCGQAIQRFFQWTPSVFKFGDSRAHAARGDFALSLDTTSVARDPNVFAGRSCAPGAPKRGTP